MVCEGTDTFRVARSSDRQHLGAGKTQMRKRFTPAEEVRHLNSAGLVLVDHFKCCETLVHAKMNVNHVYFRSEGGAPAMLVSPSLRCLRAELVEGPMRRRRHVFETRLSRLSCR
jgi:hypothetical protein